MELHQQLEQVSLTANREGFYPYLCQHLIIFFPGQSGSSLEVSVRLLVAGGRRGGRVEARHQFCCSSLLHEHLPANETELQSDRG